MKLNRRERGAAAVEFAIVMPLLMVLMVGIMEFGYAFFLQASVSSAARVGVRYYTINWNSTNAATKAAAIQTSIEMAKLAVPDGTKVTAASAFSPLCAKDIQTTLVVTYKYGSLTGLLDSVLGSNIIITGKGSMQCGG